jgi:hypothetical protein
VKTIRLPQPEHVEAILAAHDAGKGALEIAASLPANDLAGVPLHVDTIKAVVAHYRPKATEHADPIHRLASRLRTRTAAGRLSHSETVAVLRFMLDAGIIAKKANT